MWDFLGRKQSSANEDENVTAAANPMFAVRKPPLDPKSTTIDVATAVHTPQVLGQSGAAVQGIIPPPGVSTTVMLNSKFPSSGDFTLPPPIRTGKDGPQQQQQEGKARTPRSAGRRTPTSNSKEQEEGLNHRPSLFIVLLVVLLGDSARGILFPTLWPFVKSLGGDKIVQGYTVAAFSFGRVIASPYLGQWSNVYGYKIVLAWSSVVVALGALIYAMTSTIEGLVLAQTIMGVGSGTLGVTRSYVANKSTAKERTYLLAYLTAVQYAGFTCMPMVGGLLYMVVGDTDLHLTLIGGVAALRLNTMTAPAYFLMFLAVVSCSLLLTVFQDSVSGGSAKQTERKKRSGSASSVGSNASQFNTPVTSPTRKGYVNYGGSGHNGTKRVGGNGTDNPVLVLGPYCTPPPAVLRKKMEQHDSSGSVNSSTASSTSAVGFGKANGQSKKSSSGSGGGGGGGKGGKGGGKKPNGYSKNDADEETALLGVNKGYGGVAAAGGGGGGGGDDGAGGGGDDGVDVAAGQRALEKGVIGEEGEEEEGWDGEGEEEEEEEEEEEGWFSRFNFAIYGGYLLNVSTKGTIACFETLGAEYSMVHFGMTSAKAGMVFSTFGSMGVMALLSMRCLCYYFTDIQLVLGGVAVMIVGCGVLVTDPQGPSGVPVFLFALFCMYAVGYPVGHTAVLGLFSKVVGSRPQGALLGMFGSAGSMARITFPIVAGIISEEESTSVLMVVLIAVLGIAFVGLFLGRSTYHHFIDT